MSWKAAEHSNPTRGAGAESHQNRSVFSRRTSALVGASRRFHTKASALRSHHQRAKHSGPGTSHLRPAFSPVSQPNSHWGVSTVPHFASPSLLQCWRSPPPPRCNAWNGSQGPGSPPGTSLSNSGLSPHHLLQALSQAVRRPHPKTHPEYPRTRDYALLFPGRPPTRPLACASQRIQCHERLQQRL